MIDKKKDKVEDNVIPNTKKKYLSLTNSCVRFIDSYQAV